MEATLSDLLKEKDSTIHSASADISAYECAVKLNQLKMGALLVMDSSQKLMGIISERDILGKIVAIGKDPKSVLIENIMTTKLITVQPSTTVHEAMRIMTEHRIRHLPVVDNGKTIGVISIGDITKWVMLLQEKQISSLTSYIQGEHS